MKSNLLITMVLVLAGVVAQASDTKQSFEKSGFYAAMASESIDSINAQLDLVSKSSIKNKEAYEGTLLMKKASLISNPGNKLNLFKSGHRKLENAITKEGDNTELRFLRLMIQEHAPKMLGYHKQIDEDNEMIHSGYKDLPPVVQRALVDYSKKSNVLKPAFS